MTKFFDPPLTSILRLTSSAACPGPVRLWAHGCLRTDRARFANAEALSTFSGIAPVTRSSGKSLTHRLRYACAKFLRQSFHEFAAASIPHSAWAKAFYDSQRARNKGHHTTVRALAYKWIRILYWTQEELARNLRQMGWPRLSGRNAHRVESASSSRSKPATRAVFARRASCPHGNAAFRAESGVLTLPRIFFIA